MDYFTLFGLPARYLIDSNQLAARYQELQRQFHPDRFATAPERERLASLQQAVTINDAYQTLKHPLKRAEYMLSLQGFDLGNEQHTMRDNRFLTEQLALREDLDAIECKPDAETLLAAFSRRLALMTNTRSQQMVEQLGKRQWEQAAETVRKLRFLDKLQQQIEQLEERLFDDFA
jgi:molecular chaperone HscB